MHAAPKENLYGTSFMASSGATGGGRPVRATIAFMPPHTRDSTPRTPTFVVCLLRPASFPNICSVVMR